MVNIVSVDLFIIRCPLLRCAQLGQLFEAPCTSSFYITLCCSCHMPAGDLLCNDRIFQHPRT